MLIVMDVLALNGFLLVDGDILIQSFVIIPLDLNEPLLLNNRIIPCIEYYFAFK